ncbi:MAG TPA: type II toxin-antitoxin system VapC family toxin [Thermoanaerobaculia bacterium]|nr:type II toxin-antitoxin system VapC family toxin [Thermoanaerobaculia bacterium]
MALDTNRYVDLCKGLEETTRIASTADAVLMPFVVIAELRAGFALGRRGVENEHVLRRFLLKNGVEVIFADDQTTHHYASLFRQLRRQGTPIPINDIWIAALVLQHNLTLHDRDQHFDHLPQVVRI